MLLAMTNHQTTAPVPLIQPLAIPLPAHFERAFGIQTQARWLGLYWEPQLAQACYTDGETVGIGNPQAWQLFCTHPDIKPLLSPYRLGDDSNSARHYLLLDRQNQQLYVGEAAVVSDCLQHPATLEMLAQLHQPQSQPFRQRQDYLKAIIARKWLLALAGVLIVTLGFGILYMVGGYVYEVVEEVFED